jgi:lysophospholipase L1-like esterase
MRRLVLYVLAMLMLVACATPAVQPEQGHERWREAIARFERAAASGSEPAAAVIFIGSSSIAGWSTLAQDLAPIPVIRRGFGGSKITDAAYYAESLVRADSPRAMVLFAGTNDITPGTTVQPGDIVRSFDEFVRKARLHHPEVPIYFIAITPSPLRWRAWPLAREANAAIRRYMEGRPDLRFIDFTDRLLGPDGTPDPRYYVADRLHMSPEGYAIWREVIRERLLSDIPDLAAAGGK